MTTTTRTPLADADHILGIIEARGLAHSYAREASRARTSGPEKSSNTWQAIASSRPTATRRSSR